MTKDEVYIILQRTYELYYDDDFWSMTGLNENECYLEHCESGEEIVVPLEKLAESNVDYYELRKIELNNRTKINPFENPIAAQISN